MTSVLGVDGCRGGWVGALVEGGRVSWRRFATIAEALALPVAAIGVDMPIGLPATGRRRCDVEAKSLLGRAHPRVFLAPPRGVLDAATYEEAGGLHRELTGGLGLSVQTWHLVPKIREVDAVADDPRLVEVHPELSLAELGGAGPLPSKKTAAGRAARVALLTGWLSDLGELPPGDDGLDALAVAWSAHRWLAGRGPDAARRTGVRREGSADADRDLTPGQAEAAAPGSRSRSTSVSSSDRGSGTIAPGARSRVCSACRSGGTT